MDEPCAICGRPAEDPHHLTGRGPDSEYLDDDLAAPLCHDDHELLHEDLRHDRIDKPFGDLSVFERVAYRLERVAVFFSRLAEQAPLQWIVTLAEAMRRWAGELRRGVDDLDSKHPRWRRDT